MFTFTDHVLNSSRRVFREVDGKAWDWDTVWRLCLPFSRVGLPNSIDRELFVPLMRRAVFAFCVQEMMDVDWTTQHNDSRVAYYAWRELELRMLDAMEELNR